MSKDNRDFFRKKNDWSKLKDALLASYLKPYFAKILATRRPVYYFDCFAGKGMFDDGEKGSPVIACDIIAESLEATHVQMPVVKATFVEKQHIDDLKVNTADYAFAYAIQGTYEGISDSLLSMNSESNLFLYIDPYGIKSLDFDFFSRVGSHFTTTEMLLNLNTFGFFRAACRSFGAEIREQDIDSLPERDSFERDDHVLSNDNLSKVAGGDYWIDIVRDYKAERIDGFEAEVRFASAFCERLKRHYRYVLNLPIRIKRNQRPKYRMVHACNHPEGCLLMYDNMHKRLTEMQLIQERGQLSLFDQDVEGDVIDLESVRDDFLVHVGRYNTYVTDQELLTSFIQPRGITCSLANLRVFLKEFEETGVVEMQRVPAVTSTGRKSEFKQTSSKGGRILYVRSKQ